jgi:hypothetical protein
MRQSVLGNFDFDYKYDIYDLVEYSANGYPINRTILIGRASLGNGPAYIIDNGGIIIESEIIRVLPKDEKLIYILGQ